LPIYDQPPVPGPDYIWTPGYWAWNGSDYYWVPGAWARPPEVGLLWTPGYWGWHDGAYVFHAGYWAPEVGFYGGVAYGFGYAGHGYQGGYWSNGSFFYNRAVTNVANQSITNVYSETVVANTTVNNVSYNGGIGGITVRPTPAEVAAAREPHVAATASQLQHQQVASEERSLLASTNHGVPPIAATATTGALRGVAAVPAKAAGSAHLALPEHAAQTPPAPPHPERAAEAPHPAAPPHPEPVAQAPHPAPPHPAAPPHPVPVAQAPHPAPPHPAHAAQASAPAHQP
jgi:hypothetical protein